jgi:hypothetical protein
MLTKQLLLLTRTNTKTAAAFGAASTFERYVLTHYDQNENGRNEERASSNSIIPTFQVEKEMEVEGAGEGGVGVGVGIGVGGRLALASRMAESEYREPS